MAPEMLKEKLLEEKKDLEGQLKKLDEMRDFGDDVDSMEEESDESEELGNIVPVKAALKSKIIRISDTLKKIESGAYGSCEKCGNDIEKEVLEASPISLYCKECKKDLNEE